MGQLSLVAGIGAAAAKKGSTEGVTAPAMQVWCLLLICQDGPHEEADSETAITYASISGFCK